MLKNLLVVRHGWSGTHLPPYRHARMVHEGRMQTGWRTANAGSRLKPLIAAESGARQNGAHGTFLAMPRGLHVIVAAGSSGSSQLRRLAARLLLLSRIAPYQVRCCLCPSH